MSEWLNITRWSLYPVGMRPDPNGDYILHSDAIRTLSRCKLCSVVSAATKDEDIVIGLDPEEVSKIVIARLQDRLRTLEIDNMYSYNKGYDEGFNAGGKFALLSEALNLDVDGEE